MIQKTYGWSDKRVANLGFSRLVACYDICLQDHKTTFQEQRWGPAWISFIVMRLLGGIKDTWESFAASLGVIDKSKKDHYSRIQRKKDIANVRNLSDVFAQHDWSDPNGE